LHLAYILADIKKDDEILCPLFIIFRFFKTHIKLFEFFLIVF
jgi:hypothetical protein